MTQRNILIVDDEPTHSKLISKIISKMNYNCFFMDNGIDAVNLFINKESINDVSYRDIDIMLLDLSMPGFDGITVLKKIGAIKGDLQIIVLTANDDTKLALAAIELGAVDYIVKGEKDIDARVNTSINNAIEKKNLRYQVSNLVRKNQNQISFSDIIGQSDPIMNMISISKRISNSSIPVLLHGQSGSGKEFLARAIHGSGSRSGKPFVVVECDNLSPYDAERELFGSDKINSDGIIKSIGKFREAHTGTIFLKKVNFLKPELQTKVLRFIQDGEFVPINSLSSVKADVRIIASTNVDLTKSLKEKKIREDFYYRISAFKIDVPSLIERGREDIKLLVENFCNDFSSNENKKVKTISNEALNLIIKNNLNDNVRQLKNLIFKAVIISDNKEALGLECFPDLVGFDNNLAKARAEIKKTTDIKSEIIDIFNDSGKCKSLEEIEIEVIEKLSSIYSGNLTEVAKQLKIGRSTIYRRVKKFI